MSFLSPLFLVGAAAAVVPILLHLLKQHAEQRVRFPAVALLRGAPVEHASRRRLRELLLLALRVAAIVLVDAAFARPFFRAAAAARGPLTVVAVDTSLSMSSPAQVTRARQLAGDAIRGASGDVAVVTFANRGDVLVAPTADRRAAVSAIDSIAPGLASTSYRAGLDTAGQLFGGRAGTILVVTDLQASGWDAGDRAAIPASVHVDVRDAGAAVDNLAVSDLREEGDQLVATVRNTGAHDRDAHVRISIGGRSLGSHAVRVAAHDSADLMFPAATDKTPAYDSVVATVEDPDGLQGDNTRYAVVSAAPPGVLVVTSTGDLDKDAWYVRHALAAAAPRRAAASSIVGIGAAELTTWPDDRLMKYPAVVVLSTRGLERRGRERLAAYVNAGGGLLIAAGPDVDGDVISDALGSGTPLDVKAPADSRPQSLAPADVRHPIFRAFGSDLSPLGLAQFRSIAHVSGPSCQTIARFTSGDPAVLDCGAGKGHAIVFASDLNNRWNDLPIHASFVPLIDQAVRYVSSGSARQAEYFVDEVPKGIEPVAGIATTQDGSRIVVNVDPRESDVDRMSIADFQASLTRLKDAASQIARADAAEQENRQHLWEYLALAAMIALVSEGVVAAGLR